MEIFFEWRELQPWWSDGALTDVVADPERMGHVAEVWHCILDFLFHCDKKNKQSCCCKFPSALAWTWLVTASHGHQCSIKSLKFVLLFVTTQIYLCPPKFIKQVKVTGYKFRITRITTSQLQFTWLEIFKCLNSVTALVALGRTVSALH